MNIHVNNLLCSILNPSRLSKGQGNKLSNANCVNMYIFVKMKMQEFIKIEIELSRNNKKWTLTTFKINDPYLVANGTKIQEGFIVNNYKLFY